MLSEADIRNLYEAAVRANFGLFYATAYRVVRNAADAEETVQQGLMKAFASLGSLQDANRLVGWMCQIVRNSALDLLDKRKRHEKSLPDDYDPSGDALDPSHQPALAEAARAVYDEVDKLPEGQATVITLRHTEQLNIEEIAARLKISPNLVRVRLFRAYERLRSSPRLRRAAGEA